MDQMRQTASVEGVNTPSFLCVSWRFRHSAHVPHVALALVLATVYARKCGGFLWQLIVFLKANLCETLLEDGNRWIFHVYSK
jgi:hypothetical protein